MYDLVVALPREDKHVESLSEVRKQGFVPAVIFGKDHESISIKFHSGDLLRLMSKDVLIFEVKVGEGKKYLVKLQTVQKDILKGNVLHVSLQLMIKGEDTSVFVPFVTVGGEGSTISILKDGVQLKGLPKNIPNQVTIDVTSLAPGDSWSLKELKIPAGVKIDGEDLTEVVVKNNTSVGEDNE